MKRVLVTGATGFVGRHVIERLIGTTELIAAVRNTAHSAFAPGVRTVPFNLDNVSDTPAEAFIGVDCVLHLAARVHVMHPGAEDATRFIHMNAAATEILARAAANAGVRRFVYVSSVKVNGEEGTGYTGHHAPNPLDAYATSKRDAEEGIAAVAAASDMEFAIVRPPLVYGPGVRANFLRLLQWVEAGVPLPFGSIHNRRSMVSVWNLADLLVRVLNHPSAAGRVWMVSDGRDVSSAELIRELALAMNRRPRLISVPASFLRAAAIVLRRREEIDRLCGSLTVDMSETTSVLGWAPPLSFEEGVRRTVHWYLTEVARRG